MCRFAYARLQFLNVITPPFGGVIIGKALITPPSGPTRAGKFEKLHVLGPRAWPPKPRHNIKHQKLLRRMSHKNRVINTYHNNRDGPNGREPYFLTGKMAE